MKNLIVLYALLLLWLLVLPIVPKLLPSGTLPEIPSDEPSSAAVMTESKTVFVNVGGVATEVTPEEYALGVLNASCTEAMPDEALKAIAVAARTYAVYHASCGDTDCTGDAFVSGAVPDALAKAVRETAGELVCYNGQPINALMHTASGGKTVSAREAFGTEIPYLQSVVCPDESGVAKVVRKRVLTAQELGDILEKNGFSYPEKVEHGGWFSDPYATESGRLDSILLGGTRIDGKKLCDALGFPSTAVRIAVTADGFVFTGTGIGSGTGLDQCAAVLMARDGKTHGEILLYFFPQTEMTH